MTDAGPPLGVYVHWPYCARICPYCDFNVVRDRGRSGEQAGLVDAIITDLETHRALTGPRPLASIFFGGGTPSLMTADHVSRVVGAARALWDADAALEVTLEANPTDAETGRFADFAGAGVNRLSLGVQALDDGALAFLGRNHSAREAVAAARAAAAVFSRWSLDLIYARPGQGVAAWSDELAAAVALGPEHVSPYQLTIETGTAFDRAVGRGRWTPPDEELGAGLYQATQEVLSRHGYDAYEVSNHARGEAARSRHNLICWRGQDYVGVGPGAHGRLTLNGRRIATQAHRRIGDYVRQAAETGSGWASRDTLSPVEAAEERLLMGLRTSEGVDLAELTAIGVAAESPAVADMSQAGMVRVEAGRITATSAGRLLLDRITAELASAGTPRG